MAVRARGNIYLPNAIIAGTMKSGTTSVFRYLADHPEVCVSSIKEVSFFHKVKSGVTENDILRYSSYFVHCSDHSRIRLEASPIYLDGGARTASLMRDVVPDVRLIFILREPVSRLLSNFRRRKQRLQEDVADLSVVEYVNALAVHADPGDRDAGSGLFRNELRAVEYVRLLKGFLSVFPASQIKIMFYDDLVKDVRGFMISICAFLGIDPGLYESYKFEIENKTRVYRSRALQRLVFNTNRKLEPILNRMPGVRRKVRMLYNMVNERRDGEEEILRDEDIGRLRAYFDLRNQELGRYLISTYPDIALPKWIAKPEVATHD